MDYHVRNEKACSILGSRGTWAGVVTCIPLTILLLIVVSSIFPTRLDELIMAVTQRRIGPSNSGWYGIISSPVNGCNPIISQSLRPKVYVHFGYSLFPILFFHFAILNYIIPYPFYLVDVYLSSIIVMILIGISLVFTILSPFPGRSKYSILGSTRLIPQSIPSESLFNTITSTPLRSVNDLSNTSIYSYRRRVAYTVNKIVER
jgi:NADH:ubiquinone oxidoreductase subunit H